MESSKSNKKLKSNGTNQNGKKESGKNIEKSLNGMKDTSPTAKAAIEAFAITYKNKHSEKSKRG